MTFRWCSNGFTMISNGNGKRNGFQMILIPLRHFWSKPGNGIEMVRNKMAHKCILNGFHLAKGGALNAEINGDDCSSSPRLCVDLVCN